MTPLRAMPAMDTLADMCLNSVKCMTSLCQRFVINTMAHLCFELCQMYDPFARNACHGYLG
jgi:hypothetical protein